MKRRYRDETFFKNFVIFKKLFTQQECEYLISVFKNKSYSQATVMDHSKSKGNDIQGKLDDYSRKGHLVFIDKTEKGCALYFGKVYQAALTANFGWSTFPPQFIQLTEYDSSTDGGFYKRHRDIILDQNPQRIISCVTQLSPMGSYTGCELVFDKGDGKPELHTYTDQGDTIFFLADEPHEVTPISSGVRYSMVTWLLGPPYWTKDNLPERF